MADVNLRAAITELILNDTESGIRFQDGLLGVYDAIAPSIMGGADANVVVSKGRQAIEFALWDCTFMTMHTRVKYGSDKFREVCDRHPGAVSMFNMPIASWMGKLTEFAVQYGLNPTGLGAREADEAIRQFCSMLENSEPEMEEAGSGDAFDGVDFAAGWGDGEADGDDFDDLWAPAEETQTEPTPMPEPTPEPMPEPMTTPEPASEPVPEPAQEPTPTAENSDHAPGYSEERHGRYYRLIVGKLLGAWGDLYSNYVEGLETITGYIVPGGYIRSENNEQKVAGILRNNRTNTKVDEDRLFGNAMWEELVASAKKHGVPLVEGVCSSVNELNPFKYNPLLQKMVGSGEAAADSFGKGWAEYSKAVIERLPQLRKAIEKLAVQKHGGADDAEIYKAISPFVISIVVVNDRPGLGGQLRICCGDLNATTARLVLEDFVKGVNYRETHTGRSINMGSFSVENPVISDNGVAIMSYYYDKAAYNSVPDFLGQQLLQLRPGTFRPDQSSILLGRKLDNTMLKLNLKEPGVSCVPIIAASRSGKGVLTLNILANLMALGLPVFYADGKPDMACLMWELGDEIKRVNPNFQTMAVDCVKYSGTSDIGQKDFSAQYAGCVQKWNGLNPESPLVSLAVAAPMHYMKLLAVVYMTTMYNRGDGAKRDYGKLYPYGDIIMVADEVYKLSMRLSDLRKDLEEKFRDGGEEVDAIKNFISNLCRAYEGGLNSELTVGVKFISLAQMSNTAKYYDNNTLAYIEGGKSGKAKVTSSGIAGMFANLGILGKGGIRLYGRKEVAVGSGATDYSWEAVGDADGKMSDLIQNYKYFAMATGSKRQISKEDVFKPMLVLNENDYGRGDFYTGPMLSRVDPSYKDRLVTEVLTDPKIGPSVGFSGVLDIMAQAVGQDSDSVRHSSLVRAHELADKALRYYGVIGQDGIETVYDYICSTDTKHLWNVTDIIAGTLMRSAGANDMFGGQPLFNDTPAPVNMEGSQDEVIDVFDEAPGGAQGATGGAEQGADPWDDLFGGADEEGRAAPEKQSANPFGGQQAPQPQRQAWTPAPGTQDVFDRAFMSEGEHVADDYREEAAAIHELNDAKEEARAKAKRDVTWDMIPSNIVESTERNIFDAIPDGGDVLDVMAHLLVDDVRSGACEPALAEALARKHNLVGLGYIDSYDFYKPVICMKAAGEGAETPIEIVRSQVAATETYGKGGKFVRITAENSANVSSLTTENSVDCSGAAERPATTMERLFMQSPSGAEWYAKRVWKNIISEILSQGFKRANVNRVSLLGGNMYVNGKIIRLDGIVGGREGVKLKDLVDFKYMLKQFPMLSELRMDDEMMRMAVLQYPNEDNPFIGMFDKHKRLNTIVIKRPQGSIRFDRAALAQQAKMNYIQRMTQEAQVKNAVDAECSTRRSGSWKGFSVKDKLSGVRACGGRATKAGKEYWRKNKTNVIANVGCLALCGISLPVGALAFAVKAGWKAVSSTVKSNKR